MITLKHRILIFSLPYVLAALSLWGIISIGEKLLVDLKNSTIPHTEKLAAGSPHLFFSSTIVTPSVSISKSVSDSNPDHETAFNFILDYQCTSITNDCEDVVITDALPATVQYLGLSTPAGTTGSYNEVTNTVTVNFTDGAGAGIDAGTSGQIIITVQFPYGLTGTQANNTATITSSNAGTDSSSASSTLANGDGPWTNVIIDKDIRTSDVVTGGRVEFRYRHGLADFNPISNYTVIDTLPPEMDLFRIYNGYFPNTNNDIYLYYQTSSNPGVWQSWPSNPRMNSGIEESGLCFGAWIKCGRLCDDVEMGLWHPRWYWCLVYLERNEQTNKNLWRCIKPRPKWQSSEHWGYVQ